jgi:hypothetical protein
VWPPALKWLPLEGRPGVYMPSRLRLHLSLAKILASDDAGLAVGDGMLTSSAAADAPSAPPMAPCSIPPQETEVSTPAHEGVQVKRLGASADSQSCRCGWVQLSARMGGGRLAEEHPFPSFLSNVITGITMALVGHLMLDG